jgi:hypothetical protein
VVHHYGPDGVFLDWLEYTNYHFEDNLLCFCPDCEKKAGELGFDFATLRQAALEVRDWIKNANLDDLAPAAGWVDAWERMSARISQFFRFKALSVKEYMQSLRRVMDEAGFGETNLYFNGFSLPMNVGTGIDYEALTRLSAHIFTDMKLYRFHWGLMVGWYAKYLADLNGRVPSGAWLPFAKSMLEVEDPEDSDVDHYRMPAPDEVGPLDVANEERKLAQLLSLTNPSQVVPVMHGYCPLEVFRKRLEMIAGSEAQAVFIQRYGYASDRKLTVLRELLG